MFFVGNAIGNGGSHHPNTISSVGKVIPGRFFAKVIEKVTIKRYPFYGWLACSTVQSWDFMWVALPQQMTQ